MLPPLHCKQHCNIRMSNWRSGMGFASFPLVYWAGAKQCFKSKKLSSERMCVRVPRAAWPVNPSSHVSESNGCTDARAADLTHTQQLFPSLPFSKPTQQTLIHVATLQKKYGWLNFSRMIGMTYFFFKNLSSKHCNFSFKCTLYGAFYWCFPLRIKWKLAP